MSDTDSEDDFGNFSDASFEPVEEVVAAPSGESTPSVQEALAAQAELVFGPEDDTTPAETAHTSDLADLLREERPNVVYHALVDSDKRDIPPFLWQHSNLRATVLKVLRLDPASREQSPGQPTPLPENNSTATQRDDQLFQKAWALASDTDIAVAPGAQILRDHFGIQYLPPLVQPSLAEATQRESLARIPELLQRSASLEDEQDSALHDELCNVIDLVVAELRGLAETQARLETDKKTFERVITNLSGHTQRLQRDEIAQFNKKKSRHGRWHRFSWAGGSAA